MTTDLEPVRPEEQPLEGEVPQTPLDVLRYLMLMVRASWVFGFALPGFYCLMCSLVTAQYLGASDGSKLWILGAVLLLVVPVLLPVGIARARRRPALSYRLSCEHYEVDESGNRVSIPWQSIIGWREESSAWYLWVRNGAVLYLPKRAFAETSIAAVRERLRERVSAEPRAARGLGCALFLTLALTLVVLVAIAQLLISRDGPFG